MPQTFDYIWEHQVYISLVMIRFYIDSSSTIGHLGGSNTIVVTVNSSVYRSGSNGSGSCRTNNNDAAGKRCQTILNTDERSINISLPLTNLYNFCIKNKDSLSFPSQYKDCQKNQLTKDSFSHNHTK